MEFRPKQFHPASDLLKLFCAYHEAGHAIIAHILGIEIKSVDIKPDPATGTHGCTIDKHQPAYEYRAFVEWPDGTFHKNVRGKRLAEMALYRKYAIIFRAGCESQYFFAEKLKFDGEQISQGGAQDWEDLESISKQAFGEVNEKWIGKRQVDAKLLVWKNRGCHRTSSQGPHSQRDVIGR